MGVLKEAALAIPRVVLLIPRLVADDRVPVRVKLALTGLAVYIASPWDIIPDFIPVLGQLDDLTAVLLFIDGVLNQVDDAVLCEHWRGDVRTLRTLQFISRQVSRWVPGRIKRLLFGRAIEAGRRRMTETAATRA